MANCVLIINTVKKYSCLCEFPGYLFIICTSVSSPSVKSMKKNKTDHNCGTGKRVNASGKVTKANPGPSDHLNL